MKKKDIVIVFDCGATNVRVIAINSKGEILASESFPNNTKPDPFYPVYRVWDIDEIWEKLCKASQKVISQINTSLIIGSTVTTFGVDGTLFDQQGKMLYPVISWQCDRTVKIMTDIGKYMPITDLYKRSGVFPYNFNTINKLIWFSENKPEIIEKAHRFLFMSSIFSFFLTGEMVNDTTMAGTSMMADPSKRKFSESILDRINLSPEIFGTLAEPGTIIGKINKKASQNTSIPVGVPVVVTGHDTQFAIFGSGAEKNQPVLSSGTWEILMVRADNFRSGKAQFDMGITTELDTIPGLYNIGNQWLASGILEWGRRTLYGEIKDNVYEIMISRAENVPIGCNGVTVIPKFYEDCQEKSAGQILGLTLKSTRDEIYRAMLEALAERLAIGKKAIEKAGGFSS